MSQPITLDDRACKFHYIVADLQLTERVIGDAHAEFL